MSAAISQKDAPLALSARGIVKRFGDNPALDGVDFDLRVGEIHALLGENGAGKTTLMNVLRGLVHPNAGRIDVRGVQTRIVSARAASQLGIGMVHQHFLLVPVLSVIDNLILAARQTSLLRNRAAVQASALETAKRLGWEIPFDARVGDLPVGTQQRVEILKALQGNASVLLFDEPTAVLTPGETTELFRVLRSLRDDGRSLVFVSHKLVEVMDLCDRVTVLRRGKLVGTVAVADTSARDLAARMVGKNVVVHLAGELLAQSNIAGETPNRSPNTSPAVLRIANLSAHRTHTDECTLNEISLTVGEGEILAIAGVDGNGQSELFEALCGLRAYRADTFELTGKQVHRLSPGSLARRGIAVVPPDRHRQGLALSLSAADNLTLEASRMRQFRTGPFIRRRPLSALAERLRSDFDIRTSSLRTPASSLSGGNQQKIVIARALWRAPKLLIAASPTRGLDVAATAYVHQKIRECAQGGTAAVLISTELDEVYAMATRIAVLYAGKIVGIVPPDTPRETIGLMMGGHPQSWPSPEATPALRATPPDADLPRPQTATPPDAGRG